MDAGNIYCQEGKRFGVGWSLEKKKRAEKAGLSLRCRLGTRGRRKFDRTCPVGFGLQRPNVKKIINIVFYEIGNLRIRDFSTIKKPALSGV
jgi:hypothetical protein